MKTKLVRLMMLVGLFALAACGNDEAKRIEQLRRDLVLAGAYPQPYMSPLEQGYGNTPGYQAQPYRNGGYVPASTRPAQVVRRAPVYASTTTRAGADGARMFSDDDDWDVLDDIPSDSAAALVLLEHHWAVPLRDAIARAGGFRLSDGFISPFDLIALGLVSAEEAKELHNVEQAAAARRG